MTTRIGSIAFPEYTGIRCLMMPYIQGDPESVPDDYAAYRDIISTVFIEEGDIGYLTIDESPVKRGAPHRGSHSKYDRALHTEAGLVPGTHQAGWGSPIPVWGAPVPAWGGQFNVTLDWDLRVLLANNLNGSCALWDAEHTDTSADGDIGDQAHLYPYEDAILMQSGELHEIGIFTPHESRPVSQDFDRQFLRIIGAGVHGREPHFTVNPLLAA